MFSCDVKTKEEFIKYVLNEVILITDKLSEIDKNSVKFKRQIQLTNDILKWIKLFKIDVKGTKVEKLIETNVNIC